MKGKRKHDAESPRAQWCNEENSHDTAPDPSVIYDLEEHFAGTLVSVAFTLDPVYLAQESETEDGDD